MKTALVVEDEKSLRVIYRHILSGINYDVVDVTNSLDALEWLEAHTPELILLDMMLPGQNGEVVLDYLRDTSRFNETQVLVISSNKRYEGLPKAYQNVVFALKPVMPAEIRNFAANGHFAPKKN